MIKDKTFSIFHSQKSGSCGSLVALPRPLANT